MSSCTSLERFTYQPGANPFPGLELELLVLKGFLGKRNKKLILPIVAILTMFELNLHIIQAPLETQIISVMKSVEIVTGIPAHIGIVYYCVLLYLYYLLFIDNY